MKNKTGHKWAHQVDGVATSDDREWLDREVAGSNFQDGRLATRFRTLLDRLWRSVGQSIPLACQDWAQTKAAYRFLSNDRVNEHDILSGHFEATCARFQATDGPILVLQDTTEFSYQRDQPELIGAIGKMPYRKQVSGNPPVRTVCGILMHSSLAVTPEGLPLGLASITFWTRKKFKGCNALKKAINPTRVPIEEKESFRWLRNLQQSTVRFNDPDRCIHVGDRESDIYELFCMAKELGTHFLVRTCQDRLVGDGEHTMSDEMSAVQVKGLHRVETRDAKGHSSHALLEIKYRQVTVLPPVGKRSRYPAQQVTVIHATLKLPLTLDIAAQRHCQLSTATELSLAGNNNKLNYQLTAPFNVLSAASKPMSLIRVRAGTISSSTRAPRTVACNPAKLPTEPR
jgi:hypothetical protein